jgi:hypothetical protein
MDAVNWALEIYKMFTKRPVLFVIDISLKYLVRRGQLRENVLKIY